VKILKHLFKIFILVLTASTAAFAQTTHTTTQTVMFAVNRLVKPAINISSSSGIMNSVSLSPETDLLQDQLIQHSIKMTISLPQNDFIVGGTTGSEASFKTDQRSSFTSAPHLGISGTQLELGTLRQIDKSNVLYKTPFVLTVTE